jgi:hypothetical protein
MKKKPNVSVSNEQELSIDDSLDEIIKIKKSENSALKKIVNSLGHEYRKDNTNKK